MKKPLQILLIEDNEGDVEMTQRALLRDEHPNCEIHVANDGIEALDFLYKRGKHLGAATPQLILLDLNMPRMDGKRFLEAIKEDMAFRTIPVIMLTSSESPKDIRECYERHASCYVVKPFDGKKFAETVRGVVHFWSNLGRLTEVAA